MVDASLKQLLHNKVVTRRLWAICSKAVQQFVGIADSLLNFFLRAYAAKVGGADNKGCYEDPGTVPWVSFGGLRVDNS